jgi:8-oxo-dGTP diphosphatase
MEAISGEFAPNEEVDELRWVTLDEAYELLTWDRDLELIDLLRVLPEFRATAS